MRLPLLSASGARLPLLYARVLLQKLHLLRAWWLAATCAPDPRVALLVYIYCVYRLASHTATSRPPLDYEGIATDEATAATPKTPPSEPPLPMTTPEPTSCISRTWPQRSTVQPRSSIACALHAFTQEKAETIPPLLAEAEKRAGEEDIAHGGRAEVLWQWVAAEMNAAGGKHRGCRQQRPTTVLPPRGPEGVERRSSSQQPTHRLERERDND